MKEKEFDLLTRIISGFTSLQDREAVTELGYSQYHLAVAGGSAKILICQPPTRNREVVLTVSKLVTCRDRIRPRLLLIKLLSS